MSQLPGQLPEKLPEDYRFTSAFIPEEVIELRTAADWGTETNASYKVYEL